MSPPTVSTAAEYWALSIGFTGSDIYSFLSKILLAPIILRVSICEDFPEIAWTSYPIFERIPTEIDPTPPVEPDTKTGSFFEQSPSTIFFIHAAAVIPAVPNDIHFIWSNSDGIFITQLLGRWTISPKPPNSDIPILYPVAITLSPTEKSGVDDSIISPATSIPGTNG